MWEDNWDHQTVSQDLDEMKLRIELAAAAAVGATRALMRYRSGILAAGPSSQSDLHDALVAARVFTAASPLRQCHIDAADEAETAEMLRLQARVEQAEWTDAQRRK